MSTTLQELEEFTRFAKEQLAEASTAGSLEELFDSWRERHPSPEDALAIRASLEDLEAGIIGRPFEEFAADHRAKLNVPGPS